MTTCKNCDYAIKLNMTSNRWTGDIDKNSLACSNENSIKCDDFVLPNDVCEAFECVELQTCKNCDYGMINELNDLICVNDSSERCTDFVFEHESCEHWQNHDDEIVIML